MLPVVYYYTNTAIKRERKKNPQKNNRHITVSLRGYIRKARTAGVLKHSSLDNEVK